jgi:hypothetical protein
MSSRALFWAAVVAGLIASDVARAEPFGGVEFPQGLASFADKVKSFRPALRNVQPPHADPMAALGAPDYRNTSDSSYVSLGDTKSMELSAELIVEFVDNRLINVDGDDLYIFEVGPVAEATEVAISSDGTTWLELGVIQGATRGIDLAKFSTITAGSSFRYVRLRDAAGSPSNAAPFAGPDIDAVGAIGADIRDSDMDAVLDVDDQCPNERGAAPTGCPVVADAGTPVDSGLPAMNGGPVPDVANDAATKDASASPNPGMSGDAATPEMSTDAATPEMRTDAATPEMRTDAAAPEMSSDAATPERSSDAATPERSSDAAIPEMSSDEEGDGGCSCRASGGSNLEGGLTALLCGGALLARARRRRSK